MKEPNELEPLIDAHPVLPLRQQDETKDQETRMDGSIVNRTDEATAAGGLETKGATAPLTSDTEPCLWVCPHERGRYVQARLICDACGERVGDGFVWGLDGLRWDKSRIAVGHPGWDNTSTHADPSSSSSESRMVPVTTLREYVQHKPECVMEIPPMFRHAHETACTCGLDKALAASPAPAVIPLRALVDSWRAKATAGRDTLTAAKGISDNAYVGQVAAILLLERCADELDALLVSTRPREEKNKDLARVDGQS